jgi:hypothetical protein
LLRARDASDDGLDMQPLAMPVRMEPADEPVEADTGDSLAALFSHGIERAPSVAELIDVYRELIEVIDGPVLAAMVGTGEIFVPLARNGLRVHGVEPSAALFARCRAALGELQTTVPLFRQDVEALNLPFRYAGAFIARGAFQKLDDAAVAFDALARLRAHLVGGAALTLELHIPDAATHPPGAAVIEIETRALTDGSHVVRRSELSTDGARKRQTVASRYERRRRGALLAREDVVARIVWYEEDDIRSMLASAGYADVRVDALAAASTHAGGFMVTARV